ncbi:MAG: MBL fold metallo-hydrolase [Candidatus Enteromonas sp.]|nr:MBL fold metallo-hydrolase [Candidatus Enteromonas sp.]
MAKRKKTTASRKAKRHTGVPILFVILAIIFVVAGYFGYRYYIEENPTTSFVLNGPNVQSVPLHGRYVESGVTATYNGQDVSGEVKVSYAYGEELSPVEGVDTNTPGNYTVSYDISYKKLNEHLTRSVVVLTTETASFSASFLELGNKFTGDSVYIKAGDTDILIDAGSRQSSAQAIGDFLREPGRVEDGKLEYVIATHAHQDHIAGFVGTNSVPGIFAQFQIDTLIDFAKTDSTSALYASYVSKRDDLVASGTKHYTALECVEESVEGAKKAFDIAPGISMEILDQRFYRDSSSDENNYSVCTLFTHGENHYLFTGDLEKQGEESLVERNQLPTVELFKGGHHGSYTANTDTLLSVIQPKTVCICCCAGSMEYTANPDRTFPAQDAINNIGKYTDKVYVTTLVDESSSSGYRSFNGTITCSSVSGLGSSDFAVECSASSVILKESEWFKANRTWPNAT